LLIIVLGMLFGVVLLLLKTLYACLQGLINKMTGEPS